jgi:hypothetical protein
MLSTHSTHVVLEHPSTTPCGDVPDLDLQGSNFQRNAPTHTPPPAHTDTRAKLPILEYVHVYYHSTITTAESAATDHHYDRYVPPQTAGCTVSRAVP